MDLGLYFAVCGKWPLEEALERMTALGYVAAELSCHTGGRFDVDMVRGDGEWRRVGATFDAARVKISALNMSWDGQLLLGPHGTDTDVVFAGTPAEKIAFAQRRLIAAAELAHDWGVPIVSGFVGCEDYSRWFPWPDPAAWERMEAPFVERMLPVLDRFASLGVTFAMECHPRQIAYNTETALRSLRLLSEHRAWGFTLDPANLMLAGVDPVVFAQELGARVVNVHAKDGELVSEHAARSGLLANGPWTRPGRGFRFRIAGWGDVPWRRLLTELAIQGYSGALTIEHEDPTMGPVDGMTKAIEFLAPLVIHERAEQPWW